MSKRLLVATFVAVLHAESISLAMDVTQYTMPTAEILKTRIHGFTTLLKNTNLIAHVAERRLIACDVVCALDLAFYDSLETLRRKGYNRADLQLHCEKLETNRPMLLSLLLEDFPEVLASLRKTGAYKPIIFN